MIGLFLYILCVFYPYLDEARKINDNDWEKRLVFLPNWLLNFWEWKDYAINKIMWLIVQAWFKLFRQYLVRALRTSIDSFLNYILLSFEVFIWFIR